MGLEISFYPRPQFALYFFDGYFAVDYKIIDVPLNPPKDKFYKGKEETNQIPKSRIHENDNNNNSASDSIQNLEKKHNDDDDDDYQESESEQDTDTDKDEDTDPHNILEYIEELILKTIQSIVIKKRYKVRCVGIGVATKRDLWGVRGEIYVPIPENLYNILKSSSSSSDSSSSNVCSIFFLPFPFSFFPLCYFTLCPFIDDLLMAFSSSHLSSVLFSFKKKFLNFRVGMMLSLLTHAVMTMMMQTLLMILIISMKKKYL